MNNLTYHFIEYLHGPRNRNTTTGAKSNPNIKGLHHFLYQAPVSSSFGSFTSSKLVSIMVSIPKIVLCIYWFEFQVHQFIKSYLFDIVMLTN